MSDITMCADWRKCTIEHKCYRSLAEPNNVNQSWAKFSQNRDASCDYFMEIKPAEQSQPKGSGAIEEELSEANETIAGYEEAKAIDRMLIGHLEDRVVALERELLDHQMTFGTVSFTEDFRKIAKEIDSKIGRS